MDFITGAELASYLRVEQDDAIDLYTDLANGLISDFLGLSEGETLDPVPTATRTIAFEVAGRAYRNPDGLTSEAIDDYKYSRPAATRNAGVYLTDDEKDELRGATGTPRALVGWLA